MAGCEINIRKLRFPFFGYSMGNRPPSHCLHAFMCLSCPRRSSPWFDRHLGSADHVFVCVRMQACRVTCARREAQIIICVSGCVSIYLCSRNKIINIIGIDRLYASGWDEPIACRRCPCPYLSPPAFDSRQYLRWNNRLFCTVQVNTRRPRDRWTCQHVCVCVSICRRPRV